MFYKTFPTVPCSSQTRNIVQINKSLLFPFKCQALRKKYLENKKKFNVCFGGDALHKTAIFTYIHLRTDVLNCIAQGRITHRYLRYRLG